MIVHLLVVPAADVIAKEEHRDKSTNHAIQYFVFATDVWDGAANYLVTRYDS